jgi:hypothetical protein
MKTIIGGDPQKISGKLSEPRNDFWHETIDNNKYWSRMWIAQELVVAKHLIAAWGRQVCHLGEVRCYFERRIQLRRQAYGFAPYIA